MYISSINSSDKLVHTADCHYVKMMAPQNMRYYYTALYAYGSGKCACMECAAVMRTIPSELEDIKNICEANNISVIFNSTDGTLDIKTPISEWKIATKENQMLYLYHKNTADYDDGSSPYEGYHYQRVRHYRIIDHLKDIVIHDWYKKQQRFRTGKKLKSIREPKAHADDRFSRKRSHIIRMRRDELRYSMREAWRYAAGY